MVRGSERIVRPLGGHGVVENYRVQKRASE